MKKETYLNRVMGLVKARWLEGYHLFLVHGFNVKDRGYNTVDQLEPLLVEAGAQIDKDEADYGYFGLLDIRFRQGENRRRVLHRMASAFEKAIASGKTVVIIAHSNGAHFTNLALRMLPMDVLEKVIVIYISAAMNKKTEPTLATSRELNLITPYDGWVKLAGWIPWSPWGKRGARGYSGKSGKVVNWARREVKRHSDWFKEAHLLMTLYFCMKYIRETTK